MDALSVRQNMRVNREVSPLDMIIDGNVTKPFYKCTNNEISYIYQQFFSYRLTEMGGKQYKLANNLLEEIKGDLLYQFQRIEVF